MMLLSRSFSRAFPQYQSKSSGVHHFIQPTWPTLLYPEVQRLIKVFYIILIFLYIYKFYIFSIYFIFFKPFHPWRGCLEVPSGGDKMEVFSKTFLYFADIIFKNFKIIDFKLWRLIIQKKPIIYINIMYNKNGSPI